MNIKNKDINHLFREIKESSFIKLFHEKLTTDIKLFTLIIFGKLIL